MLEALLIAAFILVLGPFAIAVFVSQLGNVEQNRREAKRAHRRIDRLVEEKMSPQEQRSLRRQRRRAKKQDQKNREFFEYGGC
jgi:Flp pilus assembly protein TadB